MNEVDDLRKLLKEAINALKLEEQASGCFESKKIAQEARRAFLKKIGEYSEPRSNPQMSALQRARAAY